MEEFKVGERILLEVQDVKTSIFMFMSFKELKDMAIERITKSLERHQKMYEEL